MVIRCNGGDTISLIYSMTGTDSPGSSNKGHEVTMWRLENQHKRECCRFPFTSQIRCRKGEAQCVADWCQEGHSACETLDQNLWLEKARGQPAKQGLPGKIAVKMVCVCVCVCALTPTSLWGNSCVQDGVMGCAYLVG